jgi:hypothetical protein
VVRRAIRTAATTAASAVVTRPVSVVTTAKRAGEATAAASAPVVQNVLNAVCERDRPDAAAAAAQPGVEDAGESHRHDDGRHDDRAGQGRLVDAGQQECRQVEERVREAGQQGGRRRRQHGAQPGQQVAAPADLLPERQERSDEQQLDGQAHGIDGAEAGEARHLERRGDRVARRDHRGGHCGGEGEPAHSRPPETDPGPCGAALPAGCRHRDRDGHRCGRDGHHRDRDERLGRERQREHQHRGVGDAKERHRPVTDGGSGRRRHATTVPPGRPAL